MAITYQTPGIYVEELQTGPRPIQAVGTNIAAFMGAAPNPQANLNLAVPINNWSEFVRQFGPATEATPLAHAVFGFFQNGGGRCYVINVGKGAPIAAKGMRALEELDEVSIVAAPGYTDPASYDALLSHAEKMKDRVAILDAPEEVKNIDLLTKVAAAPGRRADAEGAPAAGLRPRNSDNGYGALYFPWIRVRDPFSEGDLTDVPPSGHLAGIFARNDSLRGVHKAPANEIIRGALNVNRRITDEEQGILNENGVNCIRFFANEGIRVWGARTLAAGSSPWRYLNVRRLFNMIEKSIARSTRWIVFEPNDRPLWKSIRRDVSAFLTMLWRQGALMGRTPEEAFFVQCNEETNPPEVIDAGQVVTVIGVAPVKPAEFVIFRIGQGVRGTEVEA